ncbi:hypothetical protein D0T49_12405 [Paludibacter sp. 221]|uniref:hypothetical protein n=1 Tax=Paludibacter sp. 221 TaxID=2302939 RepID=UPI0013D5E135|nr:hypothetical protein [Paludibacter sp. 221]NDV47848.1 hypothetical protein [Paludibacter sp. 221]
MKKVLLITLLVIPILFTNCKEEPEKDFTTIVGHTYVANYQNYSYAEKKELNLFLTYKFNQDGTIAFEERVDSETGRLYESGKGYFEYNHPTLKLKVQSICDECFNNFTAKVSTDKKEFSYQIYLLSANKSITLNFKAK